MSTGSILLMLALVSLAGLGICHKVADFRRCRPSAITVLLFGSAAAILWTYTLLYKVQIGGLHLFPPFTMNAVWVALACGACAGIAILTFQIGVRYGPIATSWLVINLSTIVPAILSLVVYKEWTAGIKWQQAAGLALVVISVVLLWRDKVEQTRRDVAGGERRPDPGADDIARASEPPPALSAAREA